MTELVQLASSLGLDVVLIFSIVLLTYVVRLIFKPKNELVPIIPVAIGVVFGALQILIGQVPVAQYLRLLFGYPAAGIAGYMLYRKYLPDLSLFSPPPTGHLDPISTGG